MGNRYRQWDETLIQRKGKNVQLLHVVVSSLLGLRTGFQFRSPYYLQLGKTLLLELKFFMLWITLRECVDFFWEFLFCES